MSAIPAFPYRLLREERVVRSVANLTRQDAEESFALAPAAGVSTATITYPLADAHRALTDLRHAFARRSGAGAAIWHCHCEPGDAISPGFLRTSRFSQ